MSRSVIAVRGTETRSVHLGDGELVLRESPLDYAETKRYGKDADVTAFAKHFAVSRREADEWMESLRAHGWEGLVVYDSGYWEDVPGQGSAPRGDDAEDERPSDEQLAGMVPAGGAGLRIDELPALWRTGVIAGKSKARQLARDGLLRVEERPTAVGGSKVKLYWRAVP